MPIFTPLKDYTQLNKPLNTALHVLSMHIQLPFAISAWSDLYQVFIVQHRQQLHQYLEVICAQVALS